MPTLKWMQDAMCTPENTGLSVKELHSIFFDLSKGKSPKRARRICKACPVQIQCRDYGSSQGAAGRIYGIWGGLTERGLRKWKRMREEERDVRDRITKGSV